MNTNTVTIRARVSLPDDHPAAPWKKGETRDMSPELAGILMRERTEDFEVVADVAAAAERPRRSAPKDGE